MTLAVAQKASRSTGHCLDFGLMGGTDRQCVLRYIFPHLKIEMHRPPPELVHETIDGECHKLSLSSHWLWFCHSVGHSDSSLSPHRKYRKGELSLKK